MTQIDASPMPAGKAVAKADADNLRDRDRGGQADGDAAMEGGKPRFGDHWRSILSSGGNSGKKASADPASGEDGVAEERPLSPRLAALLRLPAEAFGRAGEAASDVQISTMATDAAQEGTEIDISDVLAALQDAGATPGASEGDDGLVRMPKAADDDARPDHAQRGAAGLPPGGEQHTTADLSALPQAARETALSATQASPAPAAPQAARGPAIPAKALNAAGPTPDLHLATRAEAGPSALKATVIHQATHFAPALGAGNIQALSGAITEIAGDLRQGAERAASDFASQRPGARPTGPVKTLTIQLTPISLGKVTIEMRLIGGSMKVDIQVADPKALELVRADRDLIMNLMRKTGIAPDTITIQTADSASASKQQQSGQNQSGQNQSGQNQSGHGGANGSALDREASRGGSDRNDGREDDDRRMSHEDRSIDQSHLRGDIYL